MASKPKLEEELREDRISQMPDDVLLRILSLLDSTILAARTTVLSKRWNNLWLSISSLKFDSFDYKHNRLPTLVEHVVSLHDSTDIQKFSLSYEVRTGDETLADGYARLCRCICTLVEHNVVELDLCISVNEGADDDVNDGVIDGADELDLSIDSPFLFPESLFMSKTLIVLKVNPRLISFSNCPSEGCFPNLKVLCIEGRWCDCPWDDSFKELFTCCSMLEDLTLSLSGVSRDLSDIDICAPKLKTLRICLVSDFYDGPPPTIFITAPQLENFDVDDNISFFIYLLENGNSLINAKICVSVDASDDDVDASDDGDEDWATDLVAQMANVEYLSVNVDVLNPSCLPVFVNLSRLVLVLSYSDFWEFLLEFLKRCPNLKHLVLEHKNCGMSNRECELERHFSNSAELPACFVSHLQTVSITGFTGQREQMEMVEYLLRNGKVLNTMSIHIDIFGQVLNTREELHKKLLKYDKGSESCLIKLNW